MDNEHEMVGIHAGKHGIANISSEFDQDNDSEPMLSDDDRMDQMTPNSLSNGEREHHLNNHQHHSKKSKKGRFKRKGAGMTDEQMQAQIISYKSEDNARGNDDSMQSSNLDDFDGSGDHDKGNSLKNKSLTGLQLSKLQRTHSNNPYGNDDYYNVEDSDIFSILIHGRSVSSRSIIYSVMNDYEVLSDKHTLYLKYYSRNIELSFVNFIQCFDNVFVICTDDRIIPVLSYIMSAFAQKDHNFVYILWLVNDPSNQYPILYDNLRYYHKNHAILDMTQKSHSMKQLIVYNLKKQLKQTTSGIFNAGFTLTSAGFGEEINDLVKDDLNLPKCHMYNQKSEWY